VERSAEADFRPVMRLLIVSLDPLARRALAEVAGSIPDVSVQLEPELTTADLDSAGADVLLWEADWTSADLRRLSQVRRQGHPVVALATTADEARRLRASGASAVLTRSIDADALEAALRAVVEGLLVFDASLEPSPQEQMDPAEMEATLTPRELEVLRLVAQGLSNKAIGAQLAIRESTVKDHVNALLDKLGAQSRTEAVTLALRRGLIAV
jgi:DNA-binding NarL/FixJ family response regulator